MALGLRLALAVYLLAALSWNLCAGQASAPSTAANGGESSHSAERAPGTISGTIIDQTGASVDGARITLTGEAVPSPGQQAVSGAGGQFFFPKVLPGAFRLSITASGFGTQDFSGTLDPGETNALPPIVLAVAMSITEVQVGIPQLEIATEQIRLEEKQRVFGAIPNFYVSYVHNAVPLSTGQKFNLAWKTMIDPFTFAVVAGTAAVQQGQNHFQSYGQGTEGYGKRFGAVYADTASSIFLGSALFPSLFKQDPRYFYKGSGSKSSRLLYAIANAVICKGDNGRWQVNYSDILGNLAAGGISNLYYPAIDREGAELTFENAGIGIGTTALTNVLQEFLIRKLTPKGHDHGAPQP